MPMWTAKPDNSEIYLPETPDLTLPFPVSPKSVYRLARILGFDDLAALTLPVILEQVTSLTALYEVYTMSACHHSELRDPLVEMLATR